MILISSQDKSRSNLNLVLYNCLLQQCFYYPWWVYHPWCCDVYTIVDIWIHTIINDRIRKCLLTIQVNILLYIIFSFYFINTKNHNSIMYIKYACIIMIMQVMLFVHRNTSINYVTNKFLRNIGFPAGHGTSHRLHVAEFLVIRKGNFKHYMGTVRTFL